MRTATIVQIFDVSISNVNASLQVEDDFIVWKFRHVKPEENRAALYMVRNEQTNPRNPEYNYAAASSHSSKESQARHYHGQYFFSTTSLTHASAIWQGMRGTFDGVAEGIPHHVWVRFEPSPAYFHKIREPIVVLMPLFFLHPVVDYKMKAELQRARGESQAVSEQFKETLRELLGLQEDDLQ